MIDLNVVVRRKPGLISAEADDELTLLDADRGDFLRLNSTAASIWALLDGPMTVATLCDRLAERFAGMPDESRADVAAFVTTLVERGLVEASPSSSR